MKIVLCIFFAVNFALSASPKPTGSKNSFRLVEKILLPLGAEMITLSERNQIERELRANLIPSGLLLEIFSKKTLLSDRQALLNFLVARKVIDLSLQEEPQPVETEERRVQAHLNQIKASTSSKAFKRKLRKNSLSLKTLRSKISQSIKRDFFITKEFVSKIVVSDSDINGYFFNKKGKNLFQIFEYEFSFLSFPQTKKGLNEARQAFRALPASSFESLSQRKGVRFEKHRLKSHEMSPPMEKALKNLSVSQISPLTPIGDRVYIFKLNWKAPVFTLAQEKERRRIHSLLLKKELAREFHKWLKEKKSHYSLSYL